MLTRLPLPGRLASSGSVPRVVLVPIFFVLARPVPVGLRLDPRFRRLRGTASTTAPTIGVHLVILTHCWHPKPLAQNAPQCPDGRHDGERKHQCSQVAPGIIEKVKLMDDLNQSYGDETVVEAHLIAACHATNEIATQEAKRMTRTAMRSHQRRTRT